MTLLEMSALYAESAAALRRRIGELQQAARELGAERAVLCGPCGVNPRAQAQAEMGLPVTLEQVGLSEADIPALCEHAHATNEWKQGNPEPFTDEKFAAAIKASNAYGHTL